MDAIEFALLQEGLYLVFAPAIGWILALTVIGSILIAVMWIVLHLARYLTRP